MADKIRTGKSKHMSVCHANIPV